MGNHKRSSAGNNEHEEQEQEEIKSCNRDRLRALIHDSSMKQLDAIKNDLNFRFHGRAVDWLLPSDMKALVELTEETGHENGGQTIDWLLKMGMGTERILNFKQEPHSQNAGQTVNLSPPTETGSLIELTREMGFNKGGETVDWMLGMATNPMLEAINLLGFKDGAKTIEWLISQAQPSINAAIMNRSNIQERPSLLSAMNIPPQFPPKEVETPTLQPRGERAQFHNFTSGPPHQFQGTGQRLGEMQQQVQFQSNGSGHQTEYQYLNANGSF